MAALHVLEQFLQGDYAATSCGTEKDYYASWHERGIDTLPPPTAR
jgi:hypothetical protein